MAIKIHLSEWLGKRKMNQKELSDATGIRPATIHSLYHEKAKRIEIKQIDSMCRVLDCQPGDLFEYVPDGSNKADE